jgi:predicted alpha/beta superfamily hydrolase
MKRLIIIISLFNYLIVFSQKENTSEIELKILSKVFNDERKISIYLPQIIEKDTNRKFAVAYLFDGQFAPYTTMIKGMMEYYSQTNNNLPLIIISIHTKDRWNEFVPKSSIDSVNNNLFYTSKLSEYMEKEVFPLVESKYKTLPFRLGIGHSLGGTYLLYETFKVNQLYNAIIIASPNTIYNDNELINYGKSFLSNHPEKKSFIYITSGTEGEMENSFRKGTEELNLFITKKEFNDLNWSFSLLKGQNHMSTFPRTFNDGYLALSLKWNISNENLDKFKNLKNEKLESEIKKCFIEKSMFRGTEVKYSVTNLIYLQDLIYRNTKDYETIIAINDLALKLYETDVDLIKSKEETKKELDQRMQFSKFNLYASEADKMFKKRKFEKSCDLYRLAFKQNIKKGTYLQRMNSVNTFAHCGYIDEAFEQIELLANYFKLKGNGAFINDKKLTSLHHDPRWLEYMNILEQNAK